MNDTMLAAMREATRLTNTGQLSDATTLIQNALQGRSANDSGPATGSDEANVSHSPRLLDLTPERVEAVPQGRQPRRDRSSGLGRHLRDVLKNLRHGAISGGTGGGTPVAIPEGAQFLSRSFTNPAGTRAYKVYVPSGYAGAPLPLVVMLHGCTQNPDDFAAGTRMNTLAEAQSCLVVYPAQSSSANRSKCWNWFGADDQVRGRGEPSIIAGITQEVMDTFAVDPARVYIAGMSAGGAMAAIMAMTYPDLYAAAGVHSGLPYKAASDLPSAFAAMRQGGASPASRRAGASQSPARIVPTIVFHGDSDSTVHPHNGDQVIAQWKAVGSDPRTPLETVVERGGTVGGRAHTRTLSLDGDGRPLLEQWVVHGGGHAWFGGSAAGSYTDPQGPDATREMLRFFEQHPKP